MISVVLTLMVVFAVVRVFESLGDSVTDGRATIEMSGNLRTAAQLLQEDLNGLTVTTLPPRSADQGEGYLELLDGPGTDSQYVVSSGSQPFLLRLSEAEMIDNPTEPDGYLEPTGAAATEYDTAVGDVDDILAFTSHRTEESFTGMISDPRILYARSPTPVPVINPVQGALAPTQILESRDAEIVWWLQIEREPNPVPGGVGVIDYLSSISQQANWNTQLNWAWSISPLTYPNVATVATAVAPGTPVRSLHRRVLLIRPDLDLSGIVLRSKADIDQFLSNNDISVRIVRQSASRWKVYANSLSDLAERHNRAYRRSWAALTPKQLVNIPGSRLLPSRPDGVLLSNEPNSTNTVDSAFLRQAAMKDMVVQHETTSVTTDSGATVAVARTRPILLRKGKDIVLSDVLGFDLQVWDPEAIMRSTPDGDSVLPHDPGYFSLATIDLGAVGTQQPLPQFRGAFVDLGYAVRPKRPVAFNPTGDGRYFTKFGFTPNAKSQLPLANNLVTGLGVATYCTWTSTYEHDGFNQDNDKWPGTGDELVDEGHNGVDDNDDVTGAKIHGVDDPGELETSPPYPHPLRGLKVTLRTVDFGTRQVRQTSVAKDFLPE